MMGLVTPVLLVAMVLFVFAAAAFVAVTAGDFEDEQAAAAFIRAIRAEAPHEFDGVAVVGVQP